jgi:hypothetical protein
VKRTQNFNTEIRSQIHRGITKCMWDDNTEGKRSETLIAITKYATLLAWGGPICNRSNLVLRG